MSKNKVREFRESIPMSVSALAKKADLARETIGRMEDGKPVSKLSRLKAAKALGKKPEEVFPEEKS